MSSYSKILGSFFLLCSSLGMHAFQDAPALSGKQRAARIALKSTGALVGGLCGAPFIGRGVELTPFYSNYKRAYYAAGSTLSLVGVPAFYKGMDDLALRIFAYQHGVSYAVQKVSVQYDLNLVQYCKILEIATQKDKDQRTLCNQLSKLLTEQFGENWKERLSQFFTNYREYAAYMIGLKKSALNNREKELLRMIEIGAAIENLYFGSKFSKKTMVQQAVKMYQLLGLYAPFEKENEQEVV